MKKLLFVLLAASAVAVSSCDWWDPYPDDPWDPPPGDTIIIDPWDPCDTTNRDDDGGGIGDTIIVDPWDPGDTNWWDPRDTSRIGTPSSPR
jgi:hypothetical protein